MILTKTWLNEFIDIKDKSLSELENALNSVGIEVASARSLRVPDKVVVGFVKERKKLENSDKLSVCKVDIGESELQIVCGAANVAEEQFVAVALVGAKIGDLTIKKAKLRGVESAGMICSATELGLAKINEGIMVLDESIGELELGRALNSYALFDDEFIEVELTPNRGDCLSIYGIARDLSAFFDMEMKKRAVCNENENAKGIGRLLRLNAQKELNSTFAYRMFELGGELEPSLLMKLRLALIENLNDNDILNFLNYATHATGVILNAYDYSALKGEDEEILLKISKQKSGESLVSCDDKALDIAGIYQEDFAKVNGGSKLIIVQSSHTEPSIIAQAKNAYKKVDENTLYRSFRGSEPNLELGMNYLLCKLSKYDNISVYTGSQQILNEKPLKEIKITPKQVSEIIGKDVDKNDIVRILKRLEFEVVVVDENLMNIKVPSHRADVNNLYDICEEIVRIIGIDNIASKPLNFSEQTRINATYKEYLELKNLRQKAVSEGFFESVHYVLDCKNELLNLGFASTKLKLINPLNNELDTLRATLLNHLLNAASLNAKNQKKSIKLFESGAVFDYAGAESAKIAFVASGFKDEPSITNKAKPSFFSFYEFLKSVQNVIGKFELKESHESFLSAYEQAFIYQKGRKIGVAGRLHLKHEKARDLAKTYVCELDLSALESELKTATAYSKFPSVSRDLSLLVPKSLNYEPIKELIESLKVPNLSEFRVVDLYTDKSLGEFFSLSINFVFRNLDKTLEDSEVSEALELILNALKEKLNLSLR